MYEKKFSYKPGAGQGAKQGLEMKMKYWKLIIKNSIY